MNPLALRLLVVDDDVDTCQNFQDILGDLGYETRVAHDGRSALRLAEQETFDIALLDLMMPGMDGLELYRRLKQRQPTLLAILVTGYVSPETESRAREVGTWRVLSKPVDFHKLVDLVQEAGAKPLLLVVDDDSDLCSSLQDIFVQHEFRVGTAQSPAEALHQLSQNRFQVVLVDLKLNEGDGTEVLQALHKLDKPPRSLLMTAHRAEFESTIVEVLAAGVDAVCYKPLELDGLLKTVQNLLPHPCS